MQQLNNEKEHHAEVISYDRYASNISAYLSQWITNQQDVEDLLLEVFLAALFFARFSGLQIELVCQCVNAICAENEKKPLHFSSGQNLERKAQRCRGAEVQRCRGIKKSRHLSAARDIHSV